MKRTSFFFIRLKTFCLLLGLGALGISLASCVSIRRSTESGYAYREEELNVSRDRRNAEREASRTELGFSDPQDLSDDQRDAIDSRSLLRRAEKQIQGKQETEQYFKNKPYMRNDRERLEFLSLGSFEDRQRWLNAHGIQGANTPHSAHVQSLIEVNDISVGMTTQAVRDSWGDPELVEVAGNKVYGNERWHYSEQVSSAEGYQTERRLVYFESGRVVGWETH